MTSNGMRIVVATPLYPPEPGGPATYSKLLEEHLPAQGIEVVLVKFGDVRRLPTGFRHFAYFLRVRRAARGADLIYALDPVSVGLPALFAAWMIRKPLIVKVVGDYAWEQGRQRFGVTETLDQFVRQRRISPFLWGYRFVETLVARAALGVVVPSHYLEQIVAEWGVARTSIHVIWNAIRLEEAGSVPQEVLYIKRPMIVSVGRLVPWKGFFELIQALQMVRENKLEASLVIVGSGPDEEALRQEAERRLSGSYEFTGKLSHPDALAVMRQADIFVLDSLYEGLSHTLIEALTLGKPVVVSNIGGNMEIVTHEKNGLVVPPENPQLLSEALARLITDADLRARLSAAALRSSADFSVEKMIQKTADYLKNQKLHPVRGRGRSIISYIDV